MSRAFSALLAVLALAGALAGTGCGSGEVPKPPESTQKRKEYKDMTKEEKIEFINKTPMPEEAKKKQIAAIQAGTDK